MTKLVQKRIPRADVKRRQQEIKQRLAEFGLTRGPCRLSPDASAAACQGTHIHRLRAALESLGPVFSSFGIYLSSRVDLLPAEDCLELAAIPDRTVATPLAAVRKLIDQEIGCLPREAYLAFEEEPFESRLVFQSHRAWLKNGMEVTVKVVHPELEEQLERDAELLPLLSGAFASGEWASFPIENAMADFHSTLEQQIDFVREAEAIEVLAQDMVEFEMLRVPVVYRDLCTSKVLTVERLSGSNLDDAISPFNKQKPKGSAKASAASAAGDIDVRYLARCLCLVWLRQALLGRRFPVDPHPENITVLSNNQIAFTGGVFASLSSVAKANLWDYLIAALTENPDKACACLLRELERERRSVVSEDELQHSFRQVVPFRDGGWRDKGDSDTLAEYLFVHWRLVSERGYRPPLHLIHFYRGLFLIAAVARRLAPDRDSLLEGLEDIRLITVLAQFRELMSPRQLRDNLDKYGVMMMELPQKLDEVLMLAATGSARMKLQVTETAEHRRQRNSSTAAVALLLVLAAVVLLSHHIAASAIAGAWVDGISAIIFLLLGALMLRATRRAP